MDRRLFLTGAAVTALGIAGEGGAAERAELRAQADPDGIRVEFSGREVLRYRLAPVGGPAGTRELFTRSGYIHPLHAPNGATVTDDFPPDHLHQRGVFFAWTKTEAGELHPDFWNLGSGTGRVRAIEARDVFVRDTAVGFRTRQVWEMRAGEAWQPALDETWEGIVHPPARGNADAPKAAYVVDLTSRQTPRVKIELPVYRYGGMCVRGARAWTTPAGQLRILSSEGKDHETADGTRARWADMSGLVDGKEAGVTLMEHPSNLRAPNLLRVPPEYPYVVYCPSKGEALTLEAGKEYVFRYRIVAHSGRADAGALEALWKEFARG